jgi:molybdopterin-guanine dinucleotide biosynthesis protein B
MLLERVIRELKSRGRRVAVIKHSHHDFQLDQPGKDSWRLTQAGSDAVALSSPNQVALIQQVDREFTVSQIAALFGDGVDIFLTEGYKNDHTAKILVTGPELTSDLPRLRQEPLMTVTPHLSSMGELEFDDNDVNNLVNLLLTIINIDSPYKLSNASL